MCVINVDFHTPGVCNKPSFPHRVWKSTFITHTPLKNYTHPLGELLVWVGGVPIESQGCCGCVIGGVCNYRGCAYVVGVITLVIGDYGICKIETYG